MDSAFPFSVIKEHPQRNDHYFLLIMNLQDVMLYTEILFNYKQNIQ